MGYLPDHLEGVVGQLALKISIPNIFIIISSRFKNQPMAVHEEIYETISQCTLEYALSHISPACSN